METTNLAGLTGNPEEALQCPDCSQILGTDELATIYECTGCGETSTERRCEGCNRFKAKTEARGCPECGTEAEEALAVRCGLCSDLLDPEDFPGHDCREEVARQKTQEAESQAQEAAKAAERAPRLAEIAAKPLRVTLAHVIQDEGDHYPDDERWTHLYEVQVNGVSVGIVGAGYCFDGMSSKAHLHGFDFCTNSLQFLTRHRAHYWEEHALRTAHQLPTRQEKNPASPTLRAAADDCLSWLEKHLPPDTAFTVEHEGRHL